MGRKNHFFRRNQITFVLIVVFLGYVSMTLVRQEIKLRELRYEESNLLSEVEKLNEDIVELEVELEESGDIAYVEKIAREKLKMVKSNEIIYIIQDEEN